MDALFFDTNEKQYTLSDLRNSLHFVGAADCETLFIHSDIMFGTPAKGFRRNEFLELLYQTLLELDVRNIVIPTFTYSFCNHEDYDVEKSKTSMGSFNEYVRKKEGRYRTHDPLLSISVPNSIKNRFEVISEHSLGVGSGLDILHHMEDVKFLFLGADMAGCFTYVHYVEKILDVPYRFDMPFSGKIIDEYDNVCERTQFIHTQCAGVQLPERYGYFEEFLLERGLLRKCRFGDKFISCISEKDAYREIAQCIHDNESYFLLKPYKPEDLIHKYTYDWTTSKITHC